MSESTLAKMPHCWKSHAAAYAPIRWNMVFGINRLTLALRL